MVFWKTLQAIAVYSRDLLGLDMKCIIDWYQWARRGIKMCHDRLNLDWSFEDIYNSNYSREYTKSGHLWCNGNCLENISQYGHPAGKLVLRAHCPMRVWNVRNIYSQPWETQKIAAGTSIKVLPTWLTLTMERYSVWWCNNAHKISVLVRVKTYIFINVTLKREQKREQKA